MEIDDLSGPAAVSLVGAQSLQDLAAKEGWDQPDGYVIALANRIRHTDIRLSNQRDRLKALASMGSLGDSTAGAALAQHYLLLESLFLRFANESEQALLSGGARAAEVSERFLNASLKAQVAALRVLSALKALRDAPSPAPAPTVTASPDSVNDRASGEPN